MNKIIVILLNVIVLSACTFQSSQYNFVKKLINIDGQDSNQPNKNWVATWMNQKIDLYAINFDNQIIYADEQINIFYKDKQIYKVSGLFPDGTILDINRNKSNISYSSNNQIISIDDCVEMVLIKTLNDTKEYSQKCALGDTDISYENKIFLNENNLVIGLSYKIHPNYPSLELSIKQDDDV